MSSSYIALFLSLGLLVLLVLLGPIRIFLTVFRVSEHILNKTRFQNKFNPEETCVITELFKNGLGRPKLQILLRYSNNIHTIKTITLREFNKNWIIADNE
jgi:hypothetical protein